MFRSFQEMRREMKNSEKKHVAVVAADDEEVLRAVREAYDEGVTSVTLIGDEKKIVEIASRHLISLEGLEVIHAESAEKAAIKGRELVRTGKAQLIMKGLIETSTFMRVILNKECGLNTGELVSHVAVFEIPRLARLLLVTDVAINIAPDLPQKAKIISNSLKIAKFLKMEEPLVAACCAVEKVNLAMPATVDAALLAKMSERGQIEGGKCIVDGPLALDNAINEESARIKKISSRVAGKADIILCNDIESGNMLYKSLLFTSNDKVQVGSIVVGAMAPIILTSRADSHTNKFLSLLLGVLSSKS